MGDELWESWSQSGNEESESIRQLSGLAIVVGKGPGLSSKTTHPPTFTLNQDSSLKDYGPSLTPCTAWTPSLRRAATVRTSSTYAGGATSATGKDTPGTVGKGKYPVGGRGVCVSTANRYSLLAEDASDHQGSCGDRPGGATSAPRTGATLLTMEESQLENHTTKDKVNGKGDVEKNQQKKNYEATPMPSQTPTIGRGRGSVASGDCTSDK